MGLAAFLNHWWNAPFLVMLSLVAIYFVMQVIGLVGHGAEADVDGDVDADVDADAHVDVDADGDADADADADADGGVPSAHGDSHVALADHGTVLSFFGIGRLPLMVVVATLFLFTGLAGIFLNSFVFQHTQGEYPAFWFVPVLAASLGCGLAAVRVFARTLGRLFDIGGKGATKKHELSGKLGVVASAVVGDKSVGQIRVKDERGNEIIVHARVDAGDKPLKHGQEVVLVDYDADKELFLVASSNDDDGDAGERKAG